MADNIKIEPPAVMTKDYVVYWAEKEGILIGNQESKIKAYLNYNCIKPVAGGYDILPIPGTRVTNHIRNGECKCQWFRTKHLECSHLKAVRVFEYMNKYNKEKGK